jgi:endonuclease/exonuclease/phosphatase family metal-dependent hydrolase
MMAVVRTGTSIRTRLTAAALGVALAALQQASAVPAQARPAIVVLTYNIHHEDVDQLAEVIGDSGAEVVALQEVDAHRSRSGCVDQAQELADALGMVAVFGANYESPPECGRSSSAPAGYGDALLSRYHVLEWRHTPLPDGGGERRGLLEAVLDVGGRRVRVGSTHLEYRSASERRAQAEAVAGRLRGSPEPVVVMGDLNGEPGDPALAPLRGRFTDAWPAAGQGDGFTNPASDPRRRIDYVFVGPGITAQAADVLPSRISDHLPVRARLVL